MKITKKQLVKIIREEHSAWGGNAHDDKRRDGHAVGDVGGHYKDYEGPEGGNFGDESETDPGHLDYEDPIHHKAKAAVAAIQDLASAAGVDLDDDDDDDDDDMMENRRRLKNRLRKVIREERYKLQEDHIDTELDNLHKNVTDDIEHIRSLKDDIKDDHDEELRAEKEKERHDEHLKRRLRRIVRENTRTRRTRANRRYKR